MSELRERIRRALLLLPLVASRPEGIPVEELARRLGVAPESLDEEIDFLMMIGRPPFSPADFLDLYLEGGRVHVALALSFDRPPRLTHDEALALAVGAEAAMENAGPTFMAEVKGVVEKLEAAMSHPERVRYQQLRQRITAGRTGRDGAWATKAREGEAEDIHGVIREALQAEQALVIDYYTASRDARGERVVQPYALLSEHGTWYLAAGPGKDGEAYKLFRVDRIHQARPTGAPGAAAPPEDAHLEALRGGRVFRRAGEALVRVRVERPKARFAAELLPAKDCHWQEDGSVEITFPFASGEWVSAWVLSFAPHATVIAPESLRRTLHDEAKRALAML